MTGCSSEWFLVDQRQLTTELPPSWQKIKDNVVNVSKAKVILFKTLSLILKHICLVFQCCFFFYGVMVIEDGMVLLLCFGAFLMSLLGRMKSWLHSAEPMPLNLNLACQSNSQGTTEPRPCGRMLCRKSLGLGNSPSAGWVRRVT